MGNMQAPNLPNTGLLVVQSGQYAARVDMNEATAAAIQAERAIAKMTVRALSEKSGIPMSSLMRVLQAERDIKVNQVAVLATALKIYPHELIESAEAILAREGRGLVALVIPDSDTPKASRPHGGRTKRTAPKRDRSEPEV